MEKQKDLTPQQQAFLDVLFDDDVLGNIYKAAEKAGYSLPDKNASRIARSLKDQIIKRTKEFIAVNGPKAALAITGALDGPQTPGTKERLLAAKELLDRGGVLRREEVVLDRPAAIVYLPAKDPQPDEEELEHAHPR